MEANRTVTISKTTSHFSTQSYSHSALQFFAMSRRIMTSCVVIFLVTISVLIDTPCAARVWPSRGVGRPCTLPTDAKGFCVDSDRCPEVRHILQKEHLSRADEEFLGAVACESFVGPTQYCCRPPHY